MKRISAFVFIILLVFSILPINFVSALTVIAPTIVEIDQEKDGSLLRPLITGLTVPNTEVLIYINGELVGEAVVNESNTNTDNFYFRPQEPIFIAGDYVVMAIAKDKTSLILSDVSPEKKFTITALPAPTLIIPNEKTVTAKTKPLIAGLTKSNSWVHIFIDGVYNGKTANLEHESGTANFAYKPFLNLSIGQHSVFVFAEDEHGRQSGKSNILNFTIEAPLPAPTIFKPIVKSQSEAKSPVIIGLAKNDTKIKVFIDEVLDGEFMVKNDESGTANFVYKPFASLTVGNHLVYVTAVDDRGKESFWSNIIYFDIGSEPIISPVAVFEKPETVEEPVVKGDEAEFDVLDSPQEDLDKDKKAEDDLDLSEIEEILDLDQGEKEKAGGAINESQNQQGKLSINLVIFISFLFAVIAWIFWVNRELIKERQKEDPKNKS